MKYPQLKSPLLSQKRKVLENCFVSIIEAILAGSERVKGRASKTKRKQRSPSRVILCKSDHTYYTEMYCYTIAIFTQLEYNCVFARLLTSSQLCINEFIFGNNKQFNYSWEAWMLHVYSHENFMLEVRIFLSFTSWNFTGKRSCNKLPLLTHQFPFSTWYGGCAWEKKEKRQKNKQTNKKLQTQNNKCSFK